MNKETHQRLLKLVIDRAVSAGVPLSEAKIQKFERNFELLEDFVYDPVGTAAEAAKRRSKIEGRPFWEIYDEERAAYEAKRRERMMQSET